MCVLSATAAGETLPWGRGLSQDMGFQGDTCDGSRASPPRASLLVERSPHRSQRPRVRSRPLASGSHPPWGGETRMEPGGGLPHVRLQDRPWH
jgi:hypothetical protein